MDYYSLISGSDVRGVAIGENAVLTESVGYRIGQAFAVFLSRRGIEQPRVNVGHDPRLSSPSLEQAIADGLASAGALVQTFGLCTTPAMYMSLLGTPGADASIMVTASHLPWERNGYKFFLPDGGITGATLRDILSIAAEAADHKRAGGDQHLLRRQRDRDAFADRRKHRPQPRKPHRRNQHQIRRVLFDGTDGTVLAQIDFGAELSSKRFGRCTVVPSRQCDNTKIAGVRTHHIARAPPD